MPDFIEKLIYDADNLLRTLFPPTIRNNTRSSPAENLPESPLSLQEKKHIAGLMRVNHAGEIAAQALYQGQAFTARSAFIKDHMLQAAEEEVDHLAWCEQRLTELGSHTSLLNPLWHGGAFLIGALAGLAGDALSLGFVVETENQVSLHLQQHRQKLPKQDIKTHTILEYMQQDEEHHAHTATEAGARDLPPLIKKMMQYAAKIMTTSSYYL